MKTLREMMDIVESAEKDVMETVWFPTVNVPKFSKPDADDTKWIITYKTNVGETKIVAVDGDTEEEARKNLLARNPAAKIVRVKPKSMSEESLEEESEDPIKKIEDLYKNR